ncbi:hypothetical protein D3C80_1988220 [compost metagenome]
MGDQQDMLREISDAVQSRCGDDAEANLALTLAAVAHCAGFAAAALQDARPGKIVTAEVLIQAILGSEIMKNGIARKAGVQ